ncbi:serine/threonine-protein kinase dst1-like [Vanessa atalanta]|uniref:serine/threonine-protein kinase dst1-like n=1 Tax=Vanessa atalanta TaxID=42275 RepID=UPI001FCD9BAD|nr:serine/threonine-protein kinase dst1-like [Vanessa atalanta]
MVKSEDVMKHVEGRPIPFSKPQTPVTQNPTIKPITINNLQSNVGQNRGNSTISDTKTSITLPVVTNPIFIKEKKLPKVPESHFNETVINKIGDKTTSDPSKKQKTKTSPSTLHKTILNTTLKESIEGSPTSVNVTETVDKTVVNIQHNQLRNDTELKKISGIENQNLIGHNVLLNSSTTTDEPVNNGKNFTEILINTTSTPILNESHTLTSVKEPKINRSNASHLEINKESHDVVSSLSSTPTPNTENTTENSTFWFKADDDFWKKLISGNNTQNLIYFLFVPPKTNPEKETKTTIYPNGTTVEEVIERISGDDGEPKITKSTKITHKNNTDVNSYK